MNTTTTNAAVEDKNYLIQRLTAQIDRLNVKKTRRTAKIESINKRLAEKKASIGTSEDSEQLVLTKFEAKNNRDKETFEKGLERRNARLARFEKRLTTLTERVEKYRTAVDTWKEKKIASNNSRAEKRAVAAKAVSVEGIKGYIDKKELYVSVLEKRNSQADQLISEKTKFIEKIKADIEYLKNKPKTKIKLVKQEPEQEEQTEQEKQPDSEPVEIAEPEVLKEPTIETQEETEPEAIEEKTETKPEAKQKAPKQNLKPNQNLRNKPSKK